MVDFCDCCGEPSVYTAASQDDAACESEAMGSESTSSTPGVDAIYPADMHGSTLMTGYMESDSEGVGLSLLGSMCAHIFVYRA